MTTTASPMTTATPTTDGSATRIRVAAAGLALAASTSAAMLVLRPWGERHDSSADEVVSYEQLLDVRDSAWYGVLADSFATAVVAITLGLLTLHLVRARGRVAALAGAVIATAGGILFAMGGYAFASFGWFATGLGADVGRPLVAYGNEEKLHLLGPAMAGFALITVGVLTLVVAHARARTLPVPAVAAYGVLTLAQFAPLPGRVLDFVQVAMMLLLVGLAVKVMRSA